MPAFHPNQPVLTETPFVAVENALPVGIHRFQLTVVDDDGNSSAPAIARVIVRPLGPIIPPGPIGGPITGPGPIIGPGPVIGPGPGPTIPH